MKLIIPVCVTTLLLMLASCSTDSEIERCGQCGMDLSHYQETRYEVIWKDGTKTLTCGVQCGLTQQILHSDRFMSATARDYSSGQSFDAQAGYYLFESKVVPDMAPGFIAFQRREDAEKLQKSSGGQLLDFHEALQTWTERKVRR